MLKVTVFAGAAALAMVMAGPAQAFSECKKPAIRAKGKSDDSMREAMGNAIAAWRKAVDKKYDDDYDRWYYSGDRSIACSWKGAGHDVKITCTASALPCKRD